MLYRAKRHIREFIQEFIEGLILYLTKYVDHAMEILTVVAGWLPYGMLYLNKTKRQSAEGVCCVHSHTAHSRAPLRTVCIHAPANRATSAGSSGSLQT